MKSLEQALEDWSVFPPGEWENDIGPPLWYAVANTEGIIAYFGNESDAFRFRLAEINRELNG